FEQTNSAFFFKNINEPGPAESEVNYGPPGPGWTPLKGDWAGIELIAELSAAAGAVDASPDVVPLDLAALSFAGEAGLAHWSKLHLDNGRLAQLCAVEFQIADLPGAQLGWHAPGLITV